MSAGKSADFANRLWQAMKAAGMSQAEIARASGVTPSQMSRLLSGQRRPAAPTLYRIASALRVPPELLAPHLAATAGAAGEVEFASGLHVLGQLNGLRTELENLHDQMRALKADVEVQRSRMAEAARAALGQ